MGWETLALILGPMLLQGLFGGNKPQTYTQETVAPPSGYQSPTLGLMDLLMQGTLGKNLQMYGGAGMPGGASIAPEYLADFLDLIGGQYGQLQKKTKQGEEEEKPNQTRSSYGDYAGRHRGTR